MDKLERQQTFQRAAAAAQAAMADVIKAEHQDEDSLMFSLTESPLKPWVIANAKSLLIYTVKKNAFFGGIAKGTGILIVRLPTAAETLIHWSSPVFIKVKLTSFGFSIGSSTRTTFAVGMAREAHEKLAKGHKLAGLDVNFSCGTRISERADVIAVNVAEDINTVGVSKVSGAMLDFSFVSGSLSVDMDKHKAVYGDLTPEQVLAGAVEAPAQMQGLYSELSLMVHDCERPACSPARVSASLERFSTGYDPESVVVHDNGRYEKATS